MLNEMIRISDRVAGDGFGAARQQIHQKACSLSLFVCARNDHWTVWITFKSQMTHVSGSFAFIVYCIHCTEHSIWLTFMNYADISQSIYPISQSAHEKFSITVPISRRLFRLLKASSLAKKRRRRAGPLFADSTCSKFRKCTLHSQAKTYSHCFGFAFHLLHISVPDYLSLNTTRFAKWFAIQHGIFAIAISLNGIDHVCNGSFDAANVSRCIEHGLYLDWKSNMCLLIRYRSVLINHH